MKNLAGFYFRYKLLLWPILSGVASAVILVLVVIPQVVQYLTVQGQISDIEKRVDKLEVKAQDLGKIDDASTRQNLQVAYAILPADQGVPQAISLLQKLISQSGLALKSTTYNSSSRETLKNSFQINIVVSGQVGALRNFFIALQNAGRIFQVEAINIQFQRSGSVVEADIPLSVFYESLPGKIGSLEQEVPTLSQDEENLLAHLSQLVGNLGGANTAEATASSIPVGKSDPFE